MHIGDRKNEGFATFVGSPRSIDAGRNGLLGSGEGVESSDTIRAFFANQGGNKVEKAKRIAEREQERVRRVKQVRENALNMALEDEAKKILK